ncbi:MAG: metallophosphatase domain-containing protein [Verrucomicrobiota bacterium]
MKITCISDTHGHHADLTPDLGEGDLLLHTGDFMRAGNLESEVHDFLKWMSEQPFTSRVLIAGNHDRLFENEPALVRELLREYPGIHYLQDQFLELPDSGLSIYGTPWQPAFHNWAFNLPRSGEALKNVWSAIPDGVDILLTHGPPQGILDTSGPPWHQPLLGCELLEAKVKEIQPRLHVFGHIHGGYGMKTLGATCFVNAAVVDERYQYAQKPVVIDDLFEERVMV